MLPFLRCVLSLFWLSQQLAFFPFFVAGGGPLAWQNIRLVPQQNVCAPLVLEWALPDQPP